MICHRQKMRWWRLVIGTVDSCLKRSQRPTEWQILLQALPPLSSGCPFTKIHIPSRNGNVVIFYLSAQKLYLLKNKLLCLHFIFIMTFLRLQRFIGKPLSRDNLFKSRTMCNGPGTICPGKAEMVLRYTHHLISFLFHIFS